MVVVVLLITQVMIRITPDPSDRPWSLLVVVVCFVAEAH